MEIKPFTDSNHMPITEKDITAQVAKSLREVRGLTQTAFWEPVGVKQSVGCRYENDIPIPQPVRILLVANYVSGLAINADTAEGVDELAYLAAVQANRKMTKAAAQSARGAIDAACQQLQRVSEKLSSI